MVTSHFLELILTLVNGHQSTGFIIESKIVIFGVLPH